MHKELVYFRTLEKAQEHYNYCNPPSGRPDISSGKPFETNAVDPTTKEIVKVYAIEVTSWSLD